MRAAIDDTDSTQIAAKDHIAPQRGNLEEEEKKGEKKISTQIPAIICSPTKVYKCTSPPQMYYQPAPQVNAFFLSLPHPSRLTRRYGSTTRSRSLIPCGPTPQFTNSATQVPHSPSLSQTCFLSPLPPSLSATP
jgi:hypothetical protein